MRCEYIDKTCSADTETRITRSLVSISLMFININEAHHQQRVGETHAEFWFHFVALISKLQRSSPVNIYFIVKSSKILTCMFPIIFNQHRMITTKSTLFVKDYFYSL